MTRESAYVMMHSRFSRSDKFNNFTLSKVQQLTVSKHSSPVGVGVGISLNRNGLQSLILLKAIAYSLSFKITMLWTEVILGKVPSFFLQTGHRD